MLGLPACPGLASNRPALVANCCRLHNCTSSALQSGPYFCFPPFYAGDPNSNWAWFEKQKSASVDFKLRFSTGDTSKIDHMDHNGVTASATWRNAGGCRCSHLVSARPGAAKLLVQEYACRVCSF